MMQAGLEVLGGGGVTPVGLSADLEDDRKTNLIVNYLPQTMTQVVSHFLHLFTSRIEFTIIKSGNITVPLQVQTKALIFRFFLQINILISLIYTDMLIQIYIV